VLEGLGGQDTLAGGTGADTLDGGVGADSMAGGAGDDTYIVDDLLDRVVEAAASGDDTIITSISLTIRAGVEALRLTGGAVTAKGAATADRLYGNNLANVLDGRDGDDLLDGAAGADRLMGGGGADTVMGGVGADKLYGGTGADIFVFGNAREGADRIYDYVAADDSIALSAGGFGGGLVAGMDTAAAHLLALGTAATEAHGQVIYDQPTGRLWWDVDGTGAAAKVGLAVLSGPPALNDADFGVIA
jgi:Ca2+-binding RTX toxin-like protein